MKELQSAIRLTLVFVLMTGVLFPLAIWAISQSLLPFEANGSLLYDVSGKLIGSEIIGQTFTSPQYFHSRPSAAGSGYDAANSSGTNLGPTSAKLFAGIKDDPSTPDTDESYSGVADFTVAYRAENGLASDALVPVDSVTRSGSGLDPHITPANALIQAGRIAKARGLSIASVTKLINDSIEPSFLGLFGEPRVNVLKLNLALDKVKH